MCLNCAATAECPSASPFLFQTPGTGGTSCSFYYFRTLIEGKKIAVSLSPSIKLSAYKYNKLAEVRTVEAELTGLLIIIIRRCSGRGRHGLGCSLKKDQCIKLLLKKQKKTKQKTIKSLQTFTGMFFQRCALSLYRKI